MSLSVVETSPILPVVVIPNADDAVPLAEALLAGGIQAIEITFRSEAAAAAIYEIRSRLPDMVVSAGTVVTPKQARQAIDAGAQFGLAPGFDRQIVEVFSASGLPFVPGVMTPTDIQAALQCDCSHLKFFPAEAAGGLPMLQSLIAPFKSFGVRFCPTGGLHPANLRSYLELPEVFAIGGTWIAKAEQIASGDWAGITAKAKEAVALLPPKPCGT